MEDNILTLKTDLQQCIANNIGTLNNNYRLLLFEGNEMDYVQSFGCFETLEIKPYESLMQFNGKIAKDLKFTDKEMLKIKQNAWQKNMYDIAKQIEENNKSYIQKENEKIATETQMINFLEDLENLKNQGQKYRPAKESEKTLMEFIRLSLKEIGLDLDYEEHEEVLMLSGNFYSLKFNRKELRLLVHLLNDLDVFLIAPYYENQENDNIIYLNEDEDTCKSIRIVMGIYLNEEEE